MKFQVNTIYKKSFDKHSLQNSKMLSVNEKIFLSIPALIMVTSLLRNDKLFIGFRQRSTKNTSKAT